MKRCVVLVIVALMAVSCSRADEISKRAKVEELFALTHMDIRMERVEEAASEQTKAIVANLPDSDSMTPEQQQKLTDDFYRKLLQTVSASLGWDALKPQYIQVYMRAYTEQDLDSILAFYRSPAGQKFLEKTPELTAGLVAISARAAAAMKPKLDDLVKTYMEQMQTTTKSSSQPSNR